MNIDIIKDVFTWLGGIGTIFFIPKLYIEYRKQKKLQEEQTINNKELQKNQHQLDKELAELKSKQDGILFISNKQYEKEFELFVSLLELQGEFILSFNSVINQIEKRPTLSQEEEVNLLKNRIHAVVSTRDQLLTFITKYGVLMPEKVSECIDIIIDINDQRNFYIEQHYITKEMKMDDSNYRFVFVQSGELVKMHSDSLNKEIKSYLSSLKVYR
ncbi:hypothetical protein [Vagococcus carniphilus]|uniref:hypothetical protein n=1 Tax=Vagococcus carniphilus TaxID=218144 RepID=UPI003BA9406F